MKSDRARRAARKKRSRDVFRFLLIFVWPLLIALLMLALTPSRSWTIGEWVAVYVGLVLVTLFQEVAYGAARAIRARRARRNGQANVKQPR